MCIIEVGWKIGKSQTGIGGCFTSYGIIIRRRLIIVTLTADLLRLQFAVSRNDINRKSAL